MTDYRNDARIADTLLREMEEELFGRTDIDTTLTQPNAADPMHPPACPSRCDGLWRTPGC